MIKQIFNGMEIRFIEKDGEHWAIASDISKVLGFRDAQTTVRYLPNHTRGTLKERTTSKKKYARKYQDYTVINEKGIYRLIMRSNKKEAEDFQDWICDVLVELRQATGLKDYEAFRMTDKQIQKDAMNKLKEANQTAKRVDYIKANTISDKATSTLYGFKKMIKKGAMTPEMLATRQTILTDVVDLMAAKNRFSLDIKVSETIYGKYNKQEEAE
ncbi:Bro-N domain-containing protein [Staphylococcus hominis]|uniref:BRO-N domain-containing protein n=1 Tax=Staphylococcus hominis TaxID=1290 RepID=UPI00136F330C|nr:Bro-N domain-containing protein [Staphylococcus hominis]MCI2863174.1 Bro-N domain-containing protein [Staphylococcus hominis]MCI2867392.1 Bro-N domain-containing protein [Staphylococcus hominis]MCI2884940.1 Bro-N domain-containing protein [Staphylococcus hominis]NAM95574.1 phage repressor protein [Staphylococcus hominis]